MLTQGQFTHSLWAGVSSLKWGFGSRWGPSCSVMAWFFHSQCTLQHRFKAKPGYIILQINAYFTWTKEHDVLSEACRGQCSVALAKKPWHLPFSAGEKNHCFVSQPEYAIVTTESCPYLLLFVWNHPDLLFNVYWQSLLCWILCGASLCKLYPGCINQGREWKVMSSQGWKCKTSYFLSERLLVSIQYHRAFVIYRGILLVFFILAPLLFLWNWFYDFSSFWNFGN